MAGRRWVKIGVKALGGSQGDLSASSCKSCLHKLRFSPKTLGSVSVTARWFSLEWQKEFLLFGLVDEMCPGAENRYIWDFSVKEFKKVG